MPRFAYSAFDREGSLVKGDITAPDDLAAMDQLGRQGLTPVSVEEGGTSEAWWQRDISLFGSNQHLKKQEQAQFFGTLHTMLASGFTVIRALAFTASQARDRKPKRVFSGLTDQVSAGGTLADAMTETDAFPERLIGLVRIGESANRLEQVAENIARMLEAERRNTAQVLQALIYPAILMVMSILVVLMLIFFLAPTLVPVFRSAGAEPPALLAALNGMGTLIRTQWLSVVMVAGAILLVLVVFGATIAKTLGAALTQLPGFRSYARARETLRFLQTLHLMLGSGAQLPTALGTAADTSHNARWRSGIEEIRSKVEAGDTLAVALRESGLAEKSALAFVEAGEEGDRMAEMLAQGARLLEERTQGQLTQILRLITPALTLLIGLTVGLLIFTTIGAILDLNELAS